MDDQSHRSSHNNPHSDHPDAARSAVEGNTEKPFPTPDELQKKLGEFMRLNFGEKVKFGTFMQPPETADAGTPETPEAVPEPEPDIFEFRYRPRDIKRHLDRFVIQQDEAKKVLSIAVCDHYNHVNGLRRLAEEKGVRADGEREVADLEYAKGNVILLGPTGVGKTYLVKHVAELIGVPFVKADATKFSETGYVGGDVEDLVRDLIQKADGDVQLAQYGIVYIDEIDKIAAASNLVGGRDVSGRGVQTTLLKLMEETEVPVRNPMDIQAQLQSAMDFGRGNRKKGKSGGGGGGKETINTRHILFIVSGAFERLRDQISRRLRNTRVGFAEIAETRELRDSDILRHVTTRDFIDYGFEPEFIGRLPVRVVCEELTPDDLFDILQKSEGSVIRQYERAFRAYGIELAFTEPALREIARRAADEKTGARGLLTVTEQLLRNAKYELPGAGVDRLEVNEAFIADPDAALKTLLAAGADRRDATSAGEFTADFERRHGAALRFDVEAVHALIEKAHAENIGVRELCDRLFKDYQFGVSLIQKNTGQREFPLNRAAVENPDGFLSELVVRSYKN